MNSESGGSLEEKLRELVESTVKAHLANVGGVNSTTSVGTGYAFVVRTDFHVNVDVKPLKDE